LAYFGRADAVAAEVLDVVHAQLFHLAQHGAGLRVHAAVEHCVGPLALMAVRMAMKSVALSVVNCSSTILDALGLAQSS
jgi:hypothetical protein